MALIDNEKLYENIEKKFNESNYPVNTHINASPAVLSTPFLHTLLKYQ